MAEAGTKAATAEPRVVEVDMVPWPAVIVAARGIENQGVPVLAAMSFASAVAATLVHSSPGGSLRRRKTRDLSFEIGQVEEVEAAVA